MKRTKIVCTIGPASEKPATLTAMIKVGMNVCRLNMSHGTYEWHGAAIRKIRVAAKRAGEPVAILLDLQGPKARLGELRMKNAELRIGERVVFTTAPIRHSEEPRGDEESHTVNKGVGSFATLRMTNKNIPVAVPNFHKYVKVGAHLLIADGTIECVVERVVGIDIHARVTLGGELKSRKGIAIQGVSLPLPSLTAKDKKDAAWAREQDIDFVALSFVKKAADVVALRRNLQRLSLRRLTEAQPPDIKIIVKIETREAVHNFDEILAEADVIMVARGDLGIAFAPEDVPIIQKEIIEKCRRKGVPVIVATEMLASMEHNPRPTRAEASDVANAVIDHTDATMLSGESASGQFPVEAVATMAHIIEKTEQSRFDDVSVGGEILATVGRGLVPRRGRGQAPALQEVETALVASVLARTSGAAAIVAGSLTGHTGRLLSRFRTEVPLLVGSPNLRVVRQLNLSWGVRPFLMSKVKSMDKLLRDLLNHAHKSGLKHDAKIVFVGSEKLSPHASSFVGLKIL